MSAVGNGSQQHAELFFFFLVRSGMQRVLPQQKKKPVRTLGNHVHSAGVHEKEIREIDREKEKKGKKRKGIFNRQSGTKFVPIQMEPIG